MTTTRLDSDWIYITRTIRANIDKRVPRSTYIPICLLKIKDTYTSVCFSPSFLSPAPFDSPANCTEIAYIRGQRKRDVEKEKERGEKYNPTIYFTSLYLYFVRAILY